MANRSWGGQWTEEKLEAFEKYVKAYLTIMNKQRDAFGWKLLYFDGFAGSGIRSLKEIAEETECLQNLFGEEIDVEEMDVYRGAAERVISIEQGGMRSFDVYYFIDKSQENCTALEKKLSGYKISGKKYHRVLDANDAVERLANTLKRRKDAKALAFLDPFGMQINWASIERLRGLSVDLWILVPTGVIVNRLLERNVNTKKNLSHAEKLESFFGKDKEFIRSYFYKETQENTLFGEETTITKAKDSIRKIAELYIDRLKEVFPYVTKQPLVLLNNHNLPIYHLVFASQKAVALKIAQQIIKSNG